MQFLCRGFCAVLHPQPLNNKAASIDQVRRRYILLFVSYITSGIMLVLAIQHLWHHDTLLQLILFVSAFIFLLNAAWFHARQQLELACWIQSILVSIFVLGLVAQGGYHDTALYWAFPFPPIIFGLLGSRHGLLVSLLVVLLLAVMLYWPDLILAQYRFEEKFRFIASLLTLTAVSWINEHFRERSHQSMALLQRSKENDANTDALTQLANRRFVDEALPEHFLQQPEHFFPLAVIMADLDHFKHINDSFGHAQGDVVLQQIALLFRHKLRTQDLACRYGGEEFLLLLPRTSLADACKVADKVRAAIAQQRLLAEHPDLVITCSFGVAEALEANQFIVAVQTADHKLYQAKANGRNLVSG